MRRWIAPLVLLLVVVAGTEVSAQTTKPTRPFSFLTAEWERDLNLVESELNNALLSRRSPEELRAVVDGVRDRAAAAKLEAEKNVAAIEQFLQALGPAPTEGAGPEPADVAEQRAKYVADRDAFQARVAQSELAITRAEVLSRAIAQSAQQQIFEKLLRPYPSPLAPRTIRIGVADFMGYVATLARSPLQWWPALSPEARSKVTFRLAVVLPLVFAAGFLIRYLLLRWFGRDPAIAAPTYARRFTGAVAEGLASGIVPALIFAVILFRAQSERALLSGLFEDVIVAFCLVMIFIVLAWALPRAVLAPELPAWRLTPLSAKNSRAVSRRLTILAGIFAVDIFLRDAGESIMVSPEMLSFLEFTLATLESLCVIDMTRHRFWRGRDDGKGEVSEAEEAEEAAEPEHRWTFWTGVRQLAALIAIATIASALLGYMALAQFLIYNLLASAIVIGVLFLLRGLCRELIGAALRSTFLQRNMGFRHGTRRLFKLWFRALLDVVVFLVGWFLVLTIWAEPFGDIWSSTARMLRGFTVGNVTISMTDVAVALGIFAIVTVLTRLAQRALSERVLPQTKLDSGLRYSISAGLGYVGITLAAVLGIAVLGIDLTSIALIAGALSVGIGFGLQNVVNNFVSGMILLVERPIKVGDWVVVGANEGFVKRIQVRATELETFQRASVIIPNSELLSTAVVNWTHKDRYGRVEVRVGVAYGTDTRKVRDILLACARQHDKVLTWPEPFVVYQDFGSSSLDFELRCFTSDVLYRVIIASDLRYAIDDRFREEGIEIPFPQRVVHYAGEQAAAVEKPALRSAKDL